MARARVYMFLGIGLVALLGIGIVAIGHSGSAQPVFRLWHSAGHVRCVAFSPDGATVVSAGDAPITISSASNGEEIAALQAQSGFVYCLAFSRDGARLASGEEGGAISVWDMRTYSLRLKLQGAKSISDLLFLDGDAKLLSRDIDGALQVWNLDTRESVQTDDAAMNAKIDSSRLTGTLRKVTPRCKVTVQAYEEGRIEVRDLETEQLRRSWLAPAQVNCIAVSPDCRLLASGGGLTINPAVVTGTDTSFCLWDLASGDLMLKITRHREPISDVVFSRDGTRIATCDYAGLVCVWDVSQLLEKAKLQKANVSQPDF